MGLRCSLTGHKFGESEVERDREERGEEVVVTLREFKTCVRCGERKIVTENKEVTSLADATPDDNREEPTPESGPSNGTTPDAADADQSPAGDDPTQDTAAAVQEGTAHQEIPDEDAAIIDAESDAAGESDGSVEESETEADQPPADAPASSDSSEADDTVLVDDADEQATDSESGGVAASDARDGSSSVAEEPTAGEEQPATDDASGADEDQVTDDGVILDDDDDDRDDDREYGEWPDKPEADDSDHESAPAWPDAGHDDDGIDAAAPADTTEPGVSVDGMTTGEGTDAGTDEPTAQDSDAVPLDSDAESPDNDAEFIDADTETPVAESTDSGFTSAGSAPAPDQRTDRDGTADLVCPECGFAADAKPSLRVGDICPECKHGYLAAGERNR